MRVSKLRTRNRETIKSILTEARKLVKKGWTRYRYAADKNSKDCRLNSQEACEFCDTGSILRAVKNLKVPQNTASTAENILATLVYPCGRGIPQWNDETSRTKSDIVKTFTKAIKMVDNIREY